MNEQEAQELIVDYAAGLLEGEQKRALERYLEQNASDSAESDANRDLEEMRQTLAKLPLALTAVAPPADAFAKLSARIDALNMVATQQDHAPRSWLMPAVWSGLLAASVAIIFMFGKVEAERTRANSLADTLAKTRTELASIQNHAAVLETKLQQTQQQVGLLHSRQLVQVELKGTPDQPATAGRLLVDLDKKVWRFFGTNLATPVAGKHYEFWLITADKKPIPMGEVTLDGNGLGSVGSVVPNPLPALAMAALSLEPGAAQSTGPQGPVLMVGSFH
jgi:anti-sigma-K factor RskA